MAKYTTTPISAEQFISDIPQGEQIVLALRHIGVNLVADETTGIRAEGKTSRIDPFLRKRMADHREELVELVNRGDAIVAKADEILSKATRHFEIETALAMVIDAFDGKLLGYDSIEDFSRRAREHSRGMPAEGAVA